MNVKRTLCLCFSRDCLNSKGTSAPGNNSRHSESFFDESLMLELCTRPENTRPVVVITTLEGDDVTVAKCKEQPEKHRMRIWNYDESRWTVGYCGVQ